MLRALSDPVRLRLMSMLASHGGGQCVCDLTSAFGLSQPTISHHLKVLHQAAWQTGKSAAYGCITGRVPRRWPAWAR